jgi:hypothetical protein
VKTGSNLAEFSKGSKRAVLPKMMLIQEQVVKLFRFLQPQYIFGEG